ncbi:DUF2865 domain-containing protein [Roseibium hamelinense]|uniref:DUF2865 domain-containing protein n=1 Tax=Roseibium hamelinense TaxID=150831 RepID=UPI0014790B5B|nr:DUF2865 domain-containing protein [Roseibium hamelinense]
MRLVFAAGLIVLGIAPGFAATCASLKSELTRLTSQPGGGKWQDMAQRQGAALAAAERDARYFQCSSQPGSAKCQNLLPKIDQMRANLRKIERRAGGSGGRSAGEIKKIRAQLKRQGCDRPSRAADASSDTQNNKGLLARLFAPQQANQPDSGGARYRTLPNGVIVEIPGNGNGSGQSGGRVISASSSPTDTKQRKKRYRIPAGGTYRTMCVRTCDGFFFPVSFATGQDQFVNDAARCREICPAAQTELFVYKNPGGLKEEMISLSGIRYLDHDNAYRFQEEFVHGCSCRITNANQIRGRLMPLSGNGGAGLTIAGGPSAAEGLRNQISAATGATTPAGPVSAFARTPMTRDQVPVLEDPDTRKNFELGFDVTAPVLRDSGDTRDTGALADAPASNALPILGGRTRSVMRSGLDDDGQLPQAPANPVFLVPADDDDYRPAGDDANVRVVGPEYFVAQ